MPNPTEPHYHPWAARIAELIGGSENPIVVGHSLGASVILKFLTEADPRPSISGLFLIATPCWGPDFPEFALPSGAAARLRDLSPVYLYHSRDDPEIPFAHLEKIHRRALPQAIVRALDGRGHEFDQDSFPELVADIQSVSAPRATSGG